MTGGYRTSSILDFNPKKPSSSDETKGEENNSTGVKIDPDTQAVKKE